MTKTMLTPRELASLRPVTERQLRRWRSEGTGLQWYRIAGKPRYALEDFDVWLEAQAVREAA